MPIYFDENGELDCTPYSSKGDMKMKCRNSDDEGWKNAVRGIAVNVWPGSLNTDVEGPTTTIKGNGTSIMVVDGTVCAVKDGIINCAPDDFDYGD